MSTFGIDTCGTPTIHRNVDCSPKRNQRIDGYSHGAPSAEGPGLRVYTRECTQAAMELTPGKASVDQLVSCSPLDRGLRGKRHRPVKEEANSSLNAQTHKDAFQVLPWVPGTRERVSRQRWAPARDVKS